MKAVVCPVCNGSGKYQTAKEAMEGAEGKTCHGCDGKGYVVIPEGDAGGYRYIPYPYYPTYPTYPVYPTPWPWGPEVPVITYTTYRGDTSGGASGGAK
jgi:hypothetical protein